MIAAPSSALSGRNFRVLLAGAMCRLRLPIFKSPSKEHWRVKTHAIGTKPELLTLNDALVGIPSKSLREGR